ncbi:MAG TPA: cupin domain-containing protein [Chloroflexota bacterium]|nr:cupin domain-containing protein [Chloroflexota bacterium]
MTKTIPEAEVIARGAPDAQPDVAAGGYRIKWLFSGQTAPDTAQTLGYVVIEPGEKNPLHAHPNCEEVLYLISGQLEHSLDGALYRLGPGDAIRVPAGAKHDAKSVGTEPAAMVVCYSVPNREMLSYEK